MKLRIFGALFIYCR